MKKTIVFFILFALLGNTNVILAQTDLYLGLELSNIAFGGKNERLNDGYEQGTGSKFFTTSQAYSIVPTFTIVKDSNKLRQWAFEFYYLKNINGVEELDPKFKYNSSTDFRANEFNLGYFAGRKMVLFNSKFNVQWLIGGGLGFRYNRGVGEKKIEENGVQKWDADLEFSEPIQYKAFVGLKPSVFWTNKNISVGVGFPIFLNFLLSVGEYETKTTTLTYPAQTSETTSVIVNNETFAFGVNNSLSLEIRYNF